MVKEVKFFLKNTLIVDMLFNARLNFGIEEEVAFVLAAAYLNGLLLAEKRFDKVFFIFNNKCYLF